MPRIAPYTAIIADTHPISRLAIRTLMTRHGHIVVGEADNSSETFQLARAQVPDIIILDLNSPHEDGLSTLSLLQSLPITIPALVFSALDNADYAVRCLELGVAGFVSKKAELRELLSAVNAVLLDYSYFPSQLLKRIQP
ncbi:response regulator transcription factor [Pseudomonas carnis]|uniref:response regulator n=1 Tax=Pseudomonas TaxID=286 RepID=UPI000F58D54E|nr:MULTISPECIES: response regulator transcription factor [Pseudomonas]MBY8955277.1 response regulator transcription factor [Pseudomonas carnis]